MQQQLLEVPETIRRQAFQSPGVIPLMGVRSYADRLFRCFHVRLFKLILGSITHGAAFSCSD